VTWDDLVNQPDLRVGGYLLGVAGMLELAGASSRFQYARAVAVRLGIDPAAFTADTLWAMWRVAKGLNDALGSGRRVPETRHAAIARAATITDDDHLADADMRSVALDLGCGNRTVGGVLLRDLDVMLTGFIVDALSEPIRRLLKEWDDLGMMGDLGPALGKRRDDRKRR